MVCVRVGACGCVCVVRMGGRAGLPGDDGGDMQRDKRVRVHTYIHRYIVCSVQICGHLCIHVCVPRRTLCSALSVLHMHICAPATTRDWEGVHKQRTCIGYVGRQGKVQGNGICMHG